LINSVNTNRKSTIDNVQTNPLPREGSDCWLISHPPINLAIAKAAPAAKLPINAVCKELRTGFVPVKRPLTKPKIISAKRVNTTEKRSATEVECAKMYGASGIKPPAM
jgi:hypothetical protein